MVRFYGIDPLALMDYPKELIADLSRCIDALWAEENSWHLGLMRGAFWGKKEDVDSRIERLIDVAKPYEPEQLIQVSSNHAAWFEMNGIPHKIIEA